MGFPKPPDGIRGIMRGLGIEALHQYLSQTIYPIFSGMLDSDGTFIPKSMADANAKNNRIYFSTDAGVLVYKGSDGTVHNLY